MIYISSSCIKKNNIAEILCILAINGIKNIELSGGTKYYNELEQELIKLKRQYQLQYACHAYFPPPKEPFVVNLASCNDKLYKQSIEHYDHCIELLKKVECYNLSVHAGFLIEINKDQIGKKINKYVIYDELEAYSRFCYAYERLLKKCKEQRIRLLLENNVLSSENYRSFGQKNYFMMTDYKSIMHMKEYIDFELLLDLGHLHVSTKTLGLDFIQECEKLKKYVKWLHISDNNGICDEHKMLKEDSQIVKEFYKMYHPNLNVTLETVGEVDDILYSIQLIQDR